ncbi:MAG TPA: hypothetical protein VMH22_09870 [bacterium]|nr:hypothetical protein [bacterium]
MRLCILVSVVCVLTAFGSVQPGPGFDPRQVVRQVHAHGDMGAALHPDQPRAATGGLSDRQPSACGAPLDGEFLIDTNSALVPAPGEQNAPAVAYGGNDYLVVWEDHRSGSYDICGARVSPQGALLDPSGFVISAAPFDQRYPDVGFDGTNFMVAWQDSRRGSGYDIYCARVTPQGTVLDANGIPVCADPNDQTYPAVAFGDTNFFVVWQDSRNLPDTSDIYGARVTPGGQVLDSNGFAVVTHAHAQFHPAVGFGGTNFLVAWQDMRAADSISFVYATLVTQQGSVILPNGFLVSNTANGQFSPAIGFNGTNFLLAWQDERGSFPPELGIYGTRITPGGAVLDSTPLGLCTASGQQVVPSVGLDSSNFLVVWQDLRNGGTTDIYGTRVSPAGTVLDAGGIAVTRAANGQGVPAVAFDGTNALAVWQDERNVVGEPDIYGARVAPGGGVLDTSGILITEAAREERTPAVAFDNTNYLVVWDDRRGGYSDIYGTRVSPGGTVLDLSEIAISTAANDQVAPAVAYGDTTYLVVWEDHRNSDSSDIYGARVMRGGNVLDPGGFVISNAAGVQSYPAVSFDGTNFLVVWQDTRNGSTSDIYGARVTPGRTVLDPSGFVISQAINRQRSPALAFDGSNYLAVWQDDRDTGTLFDIFGARVSPGGTVLDPSGIAITQAPGNQASPHLAYSGSNYLVAWEDYRRSIYTDIFGARVSTGGAVLDPAGIAISTSEFNQLDPALAFDGTNYLVLWEDECNSGSPDIYGTRVSQSGSVFDYGRVITQDGVQSYLAMVRGSDSQLFLAYEGWAGMIGNKTYNTDRIWGCMNPTPGQGIEETPNAKVRVRSGGATIVRGVLYLPAASVEREASCLLLDIGGRKVAELHPGANDVRALAPGVYFVREEQAQATSRVVITK